MLRWLRWNGDFSDQSLDCEVDLMGFQVTLYLSVESSLSTPIVAKDGRVLVKLIGDQQILLENLQIKVQLTAVVLLHGH